MSEMLTAEESEQRKLQLFEIAFSDWVSLRLKTDAGPQYTALRRLREQFERERKEASKEGRPWVWEHAPPLRLMFGDWLATLDADAADAYVALRLLRDAFVKELAAAGLPSSAFEELVCLTHLLVGEVLFRIDNVSRDDDKRRTHADFEGRLSRVQDHLRGLSEEFRGFAVPRSLDRYPQGDLRRNEQGDLQGNEQAGLQVLRDTMRGLQRGAPAP